MVHGAGRQGQQHARAAHRERRGIDQGAGLALPALRRGLPGRSQCDGMGHEAREVVDAMTGTDGVDVEQGGHGPAPGIPPHGELALVEVTVRGDDGSEVDGAGQVTTRATIHNQRGELVLDGAHTYLLTLTPTAGS